MIILNPKAGRGRAKKYIDRIMEYLESINIEHEVAYTSYQGHATQIARECKSDIIYSLGGDGTLNEIINGTINTGKTVVNIPAGSGNDFVRSITDIQDPFDIFMKSFTVGTRDVDSIKINDRYCLNIASVGIDATVAHTANSLKKIPLLSGYLAYFLSILITLLKHRAYRLKIDIGTESFKKEVLLIAIANGKYYGSGMKAVPDAIIDDGFLSICVVDNMKTLKILSLLNKYKKGLHVGLKEVSFYKAKKIRIESDEVLKINIDGEIIEDNVIDVGIIPKSVKISAI